MTPHEIEILLHYHYSPRQYNDGDFSPAAIDALDGFSERGIFKKVINGKPEYIPDRAAIEAYVQAICEVPLPEKKWVIPTKND